MKVSWGRAAFFGAASLLCVGVSFAMMVAVALNRGPTWLGQWGLFVGLWAELIGVISTAMVVVLLIARRPDHELASMVARAMLEDRQISHIDR